MTSKVKIIVGQGDNQKSFILPRVLLEHFSDVFKQMCADNNELIKLPDDNPEDFDILISYLKTEKLALQSAKQAMALYSLLDKYSISGGKASCINCLDHLNNPDTAVEILEIAKELNHDYLLFKCWLVILHRADEVLGKATFQNLKKETVSEIIRQDFIEANSAPTESKSEKSSDEQEPPKSLEDLVSRFSTEKVFKILAEKIKKKYSNLRELTIYKALVEWGKAELNRNKQKSDEKSLREIVKPLLRHIRFIHMSRSEFTELIWEDDILTEVEQRQILYAIKNETKSLAESEFLNFSEDERLKPEQPMFCCHNEPNSKSHTLKSMFRSKSHNLYVYGLLLHRGSCNMQVCSLEMRNITTQKKFQQKQLIYPMGSTFGVTLNDEVLFVAKGEEFEIILQTDSDKPLPCCLRKCETSNLLERLPSSEDNFGHFVALIAIALSP